MGIGKTRFFALLKAYRNNPDTFSIQYKRKPEARKISQSIECNPIKELQIEKNMIHNTDIPLRQYNYSYVKDLLETKYNQNVSLPTYY